MTDSEPVPISVFDSAAEHAERDKADEDMVAEIVRTHVLSQAASPYRRVDVSIERGPDALPTRLTAYLLRSDTYTAEVVHLDVDRSYAVERVVYDEPQ